MAANVHQQTALAVIYRSFWVNSTVKTSEEQPVWAGLDSRENNTSLCSSWAWLQLVLRIVLTGEEIRVHFHTLLHGIWVVLVHYKPMESKGFCHRAWTSSTCRKDRCGAAEDKDKIYFILSPNSIIHSLAASAVEWSRASLWACMHEENKSSLMY